MAWHVVYEGFYINLEQNEKRRRFLERHLDDIGAISRYRRFQAVDGRHVCSNFPTKLDPGSLGLWLTHENIIETHASTGKHLHILEDDSLLAKNAVSLFEQALQHADKNLEGWDLLFTETMVPFDAFRIYADLMTEYGRTHRHAYLDLAPLYLACMSSFFINKSSLAKYFGLIKGKWSLGTPIDMYVRQLIRKKQLKAYVTVPFMTTLSPESNSSDIRGDLDMSHRVYDVFRRGFFQEADLDSLRKEMQALTQGTTVSPLAGLYLNAMVFYLSDRWVRF